MGKGRSALLIATLLALFVFPSVGAPKGAPRIRVAHDLDVAAFESEEESANRTRIAFGPDGGLVVVFVVEDRWGDQALVWRRVDPNGTVSPPTRIPLPDGFLRVAKPQAIAVGADGVTSIGLRTHYRDSAEDLGPFLVAPGEVIRVGPDGSLLDRLSLTDPADHIRLAAHDGVVDVVYAAEHSRPGDIGVYWRRIGADGRFAADPVRLSAPSHGGDPEALTGIWDLFMGVSDDGSLRVLYRWVGGRLVGNIPEITSGPEVVWRSVDARGVVSDPVSLGAVPAGVGSFKAAFAPDGTVCVCTYESEGPPVDGTDFAPPLLISPEGGVSEVRDEVMPKLATAYPGEQYDLGVDAESRFHPAVFATDGYEIRPKKWKRVPRAVYLSSLGSDGAAGEVERIRLRGRPRHIWSYHVAAGGIRVIGGTRDVRIYHRNPKRRRQDVTILFADPTGRTLRKKTFRAPFMINLYQPRLASTSANGRDRFAAAWSGWHTWEQSRTRYVRVVLFER